MESKTNENGGIGQEAIDQASPKLTGKRKGGQWKKAFLAAYRRTVIIGICAEKAGVTRHAVLLARKRDPKFDRECDDAREDAADYLEAHALQRSMDKENPSDVLTIFRLKALRPAIYRDNYRLEHTGADGAPIVPAMATTGAVILLPQDRFFELAEKYGTPESKTVESKP